MMIQPQPPPSSQGHLGLGGAGPHGERGQSGRGGDVHAVGDGAQPRRREVARDDAPFLPLDGRDDFDLRHGEQLLDVRECGRQLNPARCPSGCRGFLPAGWQRWSERRQALPRFLPVIPDILNRGSRVLVVAVGMCGHPASKRACTIPECGGVPRVTRGRLPPMGAPSWRKERTLAVAPGVSSGTCSFKRNAHAIFIEPP